MNQDLLLIATAFLAVASFIAIIGLLLLSGSKKTAVQTNSEWSETDADTAQRNNVLQRLGKLIEPEEKGAVNRLRAMLVQAGMYGRHAAGFFLAFKLLGMILPVALGVGLYFANMLTLLEGVLFGSVVGLLGNLAPKWWLANLKADRQKQIRRALPDALDIIAICMEGGLSLSGSLARVAQELSHSHPLLASELSIVCREIQLGRTTGEALRQLANRFDAEELRSLASVVTQAERFGASVAKALIVHGETLRMKRYQNAEAMAQKAPVKLIFPTVLCIFPALYVVLMGPAFLLFLELLENL